FTVNLAFDANRDGNLTDRPASGDVIKQIDNGEQRLSAPTFSPPALIQLLAASPGTDGSLGRNTFRAAGIASFDMAVVKKLSLTERQTLLFRAEVFNMFNRTHFATPI